jgi:pyruvate dehydrogenase E2 component (dihydrolipoamide acetyltransferase)
MTVAARTIASPYARRLSRQRGVSLSGVSGSGPSGRIVAADILAFKAPSLSTAALSNHPAEAVASKVVTVFSARIRTGAARELLAGFAAARPEISLETLVVRAAGRFLQDAGSTGMIHLEGAEDDLHALDIAEAATLSLGILKDRLATLPKGTRSEAVLSLRSMGEVGIRAVSVPLLPRQRMRLVLSMEGDMAECLLCFDASEVTEDSAIDLLLRIQADFDHPLRLFA